MPKTRIKKTLEALTKENAHCQFVRRLSSIERREKSTINTMSVRREIMSI